MTIENKIDRDEDRIEIDLTGPKGNAFYLLGEAESLAKQMSWDKSNIEELLVDMRSEDYEHLVETFDNAFGEYVTLLR